MTGLLSWFDEVSQADIDAMLRDPLLALVKRYDRLTEQEDPRIVYVQVQDDADHWHRVSMSGSITWAEWDRIPF